MVNMRFYYKKFNIHRHLKSGNEQRPLSSYQMLVGAGPQLFLTTKFVIFKEVFTNVGRWEESSELDYVYTRLDISV